MTPIWVLRTCSRILWGGSVQCPTLQNYHKTQKTNKNMIVCHLNHFQLMVRSRKFYATGLGLKYCISLPLNLCLCPVVGCYSCRTPDQHLLNYLRQCCKQGSTCRGRSRILEWRVDSPQFNNASPMFFVFPLRSLRPPTIKKVCGYHPGKIV